MKGSSKRKLDQQVFLEQVHECRDKGYLLSSKIGSSAFSKVYLAYARAHYAQLQAGLRPAGKVPHHGEQARLLP